MNRPACETTLRVSVVIPAFNEERLLPGTLDHLRRSLGEAGLAAHEWEVVVCDNASTDATARIAAEQGATVVFESHRQIARARNCGARAARAPHLLFVDADTWPSTELIGESLAMMERGHACGGGSVVDGTGLRPGLRPLLGLWNLSSRLGRLACGAFLFCEARAFRDVGGFSQAFYAAEEIELSRRLAVWGRRQGRPFRIITRFPLRTSMRKLDLYSARELGWMMLRGVASPLRALKDRRYLGAWYDGRR